MLNLTDSRARLQQELESTTAFQSDYDQELLEALKKELAAVKLSREEISQYVDVVQGDFLLLKGEAEHEIDLVSAKLEEAQATSGGHSAAGSRRHPPTRSGRVEDDACWHSSRHNPACRQPAS